MVAAQDRRQSSSIVGQLLVISNSWATDQGHHCSKRWTDWVLARLQDSALTDCHTCKQLDQPDLTDVNCATCAMQLR